MTNLSFFDIFSLSLHLLSNFTLSWKNKNIVITDKGHRLDCNVTYDREERFWTIIHQQIFCFSKNDWNIIN